MAKLVIGSASTSLTRMRGLRLLNGVLEDDLDPAAHLPHLARRQLVDPLAVQEHLAIRGIGQAQDGPPYGGFATAGSHRPRTGSRRPRR